MQVEACCLLSTHTHDSHTQTQHIYIYTHTHTPLKFPSLSPAEPPEPITANQLHPNVFIIMNYQLNYIALSGEYITISGLLHFGLS